MTERLEAWLEGRHAGRFTRDADGRIGFSYSDDAPSTPISLSLPREGTTTRAAAARFLDNLLPDQEHTRRRMAQAYGVASTGTFDLLRTVGGDVAGGLVLLPDGEAPPTGLAQLNPALDRDVADRINSIKLDPDAWVPRQTPARFSLAGTQGKFALARVDRNWYWSNAAVPSTHIVKPARPEHLHLEEAEAAALTLAAEAGLPAPRAAVLQMTDQTAFVVERFDRVFDDTVFATRLHAEDLAQALGVDVARKYSVTAAQIVEKLRSVDATGGVVRAFLRQLAFNVLLGNADAHAKNYSVLLRPDAVSLAPIYDAVPTGLYPAFDQELAMRIAGARFPQAVTQNHWRKLARTSGIDEEEVVTLVEEVARGVAARNDTAWRTLDDDQATLLKETVERNVAVALARPRRATT
ncbi:HipA domain-containing protein [Rathayibacter sp. VKM Ac-2928]|uniref:HipA domain-containing protein n=1 Tax=Rathayibacter sp. VKM Ac-2928 TaxID=2929479 RepID=UPI001FB20F60|nr:HipA domain-containing protein [Rathayibacter sp. VKM Ac-2928]MCJ1683713.1 HipA domain-containing protein [Rathayibacter sp. VKM Ac-2928]